MFKASKLGFALLLISCVIIVYFTMDGFSGKKLIQTSNYDRWLGKLKDSRVQFRTISVILAFLPASTVGDLEQRRRLWLELFDTDEEPVSRLPDVVGIGSRKCGTGTLQTFLSYHPLIRSSPKEIHFYDRYHSKGLEYYRQLLPSATQRQLVTEKTPAYFRSRPFDLPDVMLTDMPKVKLWLILCNPTTRAFSDYVMRKSRGNKIIGNITFDSYMDTYLPMVQNIFSNWTEEYDGLWNKDYVFESLEKDVRSYSFAHGIYAYFLKRWLKVYPPDRLLILDGEEFIHDPGQVMENLQEYLDIPKVLLRQDFIRHPTRGLYCIRPWWKSNYDFHAEYSRKKSWESNLICSVPKKGMTRSLTAKFHLNAKQRNRLQKFFEPYNQMLYRLLQRNFGW